MHYFLFTFCVIQLIYAASLTDVADENVPCEYIAAHGWIDAKFNKTCFMCNSTTINSSEFTISHEYDATIGGLNFFGNKDILFLPKNPARQFPSLETYDAGNCSIKQIFKSNFEKLHKLKYLYLQSNAIEKINSDTFEDLIHLEQLSLCK